MSDIVGILLAAGQGQRFGSDKRLSLLADGTPMVLASARKLVDACPRTVAVIRPDDTALAVILAEAGLKTVMCPASALGMGHSLACGVKASADATGWLIALADMPYIRPESYQKVLSAMRDGATMARAACNGRPGHPVGFAALCYNELASLTGDRGGQSALVNNPNVELYPVDDLGVLKDIDRLEDL